MAAAVAFHAAEGEEARLVVAVASRAAEGGEALVAVADGSELVRECKQPHDEDETARSWSSGRKKCVRKVFLTTWVSAAH